MSEQRYELIGFTHAARIESWLRGRNPGHLPLMAYHGPHRIAVFTLRDGIELARRGKSPRLPGMMSEQEFGDVVNRPDVPILPVAVDDGCSQLRARIAELEAQLGVSDTCCRVLAENSDAAGRRITELEQQRAGVPEQCKHDGGKCGLGGFCAQCPHVSGDAFVTAPQPADVGADVYSLAHEVWATAQLGPADSVSDAVDRIAALLTPREKRTAAAEAGADEQMQQFINLLDDYTASALSIRWDINATPTAHKQKVIDAYRAAISTQARAQLTEGADVIAAARRVVSWLDWSGGLPVVGGESMTQDVMALRDAIKGKRALTAAGGRDDVATLRNALEQCITSMLDSGYSTKAVVIAAAREALAASQPAQEGKAE